MLDENESPETAAKREFLEETGYTINRIVKVTPALFFEPGLSDSNMLIVFAEVRFWVNRLKGSDIQYTQSV